MTALPSADSLQHDVLQDDGLKHGFFTRRGGVSSGLYAALNCGPGSADDAAAVTENRRLVAASLGVAVEQLLTLNQIHSTRCITATQPWRHEDRPAADAMATAVPGLALGVLAADCAPVLLADPVARVIGAAHSGWKGALGGVVDQTIDAMLDLGATVPNLRVVIGPCIGPLSYEVGPEFRETFVADAADHARFFAAAARSGHFRFDLPGFLLAKLARRGIHAAWTGHDTLPDPDRFFSFRRKTLAGEADYGRMISCVMIRP